MSTVESPPSRRSTSIRLFGLLGAVAFATALVLVVRHDAHHPRKIRMASGPSKTSGAMILRSFAGELERRGYEVALVETGDAIDELDALRERNLDFALVSSAVELHRLHPDLREVTPFFEEALHLLVKRERLPAFETGGLEGLRGLRVDLGPPGSAGAYLAREVLRFAEIPCAEKPDADHCGAEHTPIHDLLDRIETGPRERLPDAIFRLAAVPSAVALALIEEADYALVALPFADSFRLAALLSDEQEGTNDTAALVERRSTLEVRLPPFLYGTSPPDPAEPLPTIGAGLLLVAHRDVPAALVEDVVETALETRFARVLDPHLDRALLENPSPLPLHAGTRAYIARERPLVAASDVDRLANTLSVVGAVVGGLLFAWQGWRQRLRAKRDSQIAEYQLEVAALERRITELELAAQLELEPLAELQRELLQLKSAALARFSAGELGDEVQVGDLLAPLNAARDHVGNLLLHVRESLEEEARRQGRSAESVWEERIESGEGASDHAHS